MGAIRARPEDARGCARDSAPHPARVRARRARERSGAAAGAAHVRAGRRRSDRRRAGRHAGGDRAADAARRVPVDRHHAGRASSWSKRARRSCPRFPKSCATAARASLATPGHRGAGGRRGDRRSTRDGVMAGQPSGSPPARSCGRPAWRPRRWSRRLAFHWIAPAVCWSSRICRFPGHPEVFVVGDAAAFLHQGGKPLPGVAQAAMQQAAHAARDDPEPRGAGGPRRRSSTATTAAWRSSAAAPPLPISAGCSFSGHDRVAAWLFLHIFMLIGFRNRLLVFLQWAASYLTFQRSVRLITYQDQLDRF